VDGLDALLEVLPALLGGATSFFGLLVSDRARFVTEPGRLRSEVAADIAILEKLAPGGGRTRP
jgi:hypothetical protein